MKTTKLMSIAVVISITALNLSAKNLKVKTSATEDGMLVDTNGDGVVDKAESTSKDSKQPLEVRVGKRGKSQRRAIVEFELPATVASVKKAVLFLSFNGTFGCAPDKEGKSGPKTIIWYYLSPEADGKVEITDDGTGKKLGTLLPATPLKNAKRPVSFDVTRAIQAAIASKSKFIGFRLEVDDNETLETAWRFRTSEFAKKYGEAFCPHLVITTE